MTYADYSYGSMMDPPDPSRTLWNVLRRRCSWAEWREHREYLSKKAERERWRCRDDAFRQSLTPEEHQMMAEASRMITELAFRERMK